MATKAGIRLVDNQIAKTVMQQQPHSLHFSEPCVLHCLDKLVLDAPEKSRDVPRNIWLSQSDEAIYSNLQNPRNYWRRWANNLLWLFAKDRDTFWQLLILLIPLTHCSLCSASNMNDYNCSCTNAAHMHNWWLCVGWWDSAHEILLFIKVQCNLCKKPKASAVAAHNLIIHILSARC